MAEAEPSCIPRILRTAKHNNAMQQVSSLLIFDGLHFCQYLEGSKLKLDALMQRIIIDPRHAEVKILAQGQMTTSRRFPEWPLAFALTEHPDALNVFAESGEQSPLIVLELLLPSLDLGELDLTDQTPTKS